LARVGTGGGLLWMW